MLINQFSAFAQTGRAGTSSDPPLFIDSINEGIRARKAQEAKTLAEASRSSELDRQQKARAERDFVSRREAARIAVRNLPDSPSRQQQLDQFSCTYPPSAITQPSSQAIDQCMSELKAFRERVERDAAAELEMKAAQEQRAEQKRKEEEAVRLAQERKVEEDRKARAAALLAAQATAEAERRSSVISVAVTLLSLGGIGMAAFQYRRKHSWASIVTALVMGCLSGLFLYFAAALMIGGSAMLLSRTFVVIAFFGGWAISTHLLIKGTASASKILARGFLLGAAEWFSMIPMGFFFAGRAVSETVTRAGASDASQVGAVIGGGIFASLTGFVSVALAFTCLIGYAITHFMTREMKAESIESTESTGTTRKCPECAEIIKTDARKCRFCGTALVEKYAESR